jgi:hypothetical protein
MMDIVINTGIANGAMAEMFKIMCKWNRNLKLLLRKRWNYAFNF